MKETGILTEMTTEAEVKEIICDYVLITYDIPAKEKALRDAFLRDAKAIGAIQYTQSVYLLPQSVKAIELANKLASIGKAVVFTSSPVSQKVALEITTKYSDSIMTRCAYISQRLAICQDYIATGQLGVALRMGLKTGRLLKQLAVIKESFNPKWFETELEKLTSQWKEIYEGMVCQK